MERSPHAPTLLVLLVALACAALTVSCEQKQHVVGGRRSNGWAPGVNYTVWAANERFYVGDWLAFFYEKGYYDVMQVNETDYERCSSDHPLTNCSKGNSYTFQLNRTGPYYFICSRGQCWSGMKLAINVQPVPPPAPAPSSAKSGAASVGPAWPAAIVAPMLAVILAGSMSTAFGRVIV